MLGLNLDVAHPEHETPLPNAVKKMSEEPEPESDAESVDIPASAKKSATATAPDVAQPVIETSESAEVAEGAPAEVAS